MNKKKNLTTKETFTLAVQNHQKNNLQVAEKLYKETLKTNPNHIETIFLLGSLSAQTNNFDKAKKFFQKAIQINPNHINAHNNLGNALKELGEYRKAIGCYEKAIQINPNYAKAHYNLGIVFKELGEQKKAIDCYQKAIQINPNHVNAHNNLGMELKELGEYRKAIGCYEKAIQVNPNHVEAHNNLGIVLNELGEHQKAISCCEKAIQIQPNYVNARNNLGLILSELGEHQKAISCCEKAIHIEPNNLTSHWLSMNTFPIIYENLKEINHYRKRFENGIKKINQLLDTQLQYTKKQLINAINSSTNFYLHYQGGDVLELQKHYAHLVERVTQKIYQEFHKEIKIKQSIAFIKIGFISSFFTNHSVSKMYKNLIQKLDQKFFKRFVYYADNKFDHITNEIKQDADHFFSHTDVDQLINQISKDNLDVLLYLDIGMSPRIQILSSLRLAPIQCNTYGHPVTSGFKNIDYYFSSELMESQNSQKHYSEKLISLPGIGINYDSPNLSIIKKPNILNKSNATIFLNLQSLFKLLPQDDHIYLDILKKHSNCCFWFLQGEKNSITSIFKERISKLFQKEGRAFEKYSYFHPRCGSEEFLGLIEESDIILDSFNWSGGNTSLEAISLNKPIVTCPSGFMRGRYTYAILKILDIEETIASSKKEYIEIAVKLAGDINFRNFIVNKIKERKNKLFNDDKPVRFFEDVIRKKLL
jgi:predicted O-linked N-acetylglucosamine transferase (SPINDLY family)|tara:strand:+ start:259 stop:2370 length:2112 start_codon:yes stop_codon:yes gene_type:complete